MVTNNLKKRAAIAAIEYLNDKLTQGNVLGIGTGSTVNELIKLLPQLNQEVTLVSSSQQTTMLLQDNKLSVENLNNVTHIDYYIDGSDEIDSQFNMIKGGGGALTQEKVLASISKNFLCIASEQKYVKQLGEFPIAVEVLPYARSIVGRAIVQLGGTPIYRQGYITDNCNIIIDIHNPDFIINNMMENKINSITGVVENGIFCNFPASTLFLAKESEVTILHNYNDNSAQR